MGLHYHCNYPVLNRLLRLLLQLNRHRANVQGHPGERPLLLLLLPPPSSHHPHLLDCPFRHQLWTPINIILLNLVCSDFSVSILGNPFTFASALYRRWIFGQSMCVFYGYFMSLLGITSITTLTVLSYERFCLVCRPLSSRQAHNHNSYWTVLFIWTYSILLTTPPIFGWGQYVVEVPNVRYEAM